MTCQRWTPCALLCSCALAFSFCARDKADDSQTEADKVEPGGSKAPPPAPKPLDMSFVPIVALEELDTVPLEGMPPCSLTLDTLRPALESIATYRKQLAATTDEASAVKLLSELSTDLASRVPTIAVRTETDELRRISAEVSAAMGDLAESLQQASDALTAHDKQAAAANLRRIHNGVANTRSSVKGLISQCAQ